MGRITQKSIQEVMETVKVEDIVGEFVNLKRRGVNLIGLCPFHNEKTPSFNVNPARNIFKCFGCDKGGDPVRFLMELESYSYPEAIRFLAARYGIELVEEESSNKSQEERRLIDDLFALNHYADQFYRKQLWDTDHGKSIALGYFKNRGFREETIRKWGLGYAPDKKDAFVLQSINDGYKIDQLKESGFATQYGRDFFRGRVMFPIRNLSGKTIGFGGRILSKTAKVAKYMNSVDSAIYQKSKVLYGAHFARQSIRKLDECIMVEGYTDTISLHQAGIENVVAPCGTSLTEGQIRVIKRYTPNITFIFDGDAAGKKAALRGLDMVLEQDMNVKVVLLPDGDDPDSLLRQLGSTQFKEFVERHRKDFILFKTGLLMEEAGGDPIKKAGLIKDVIASIAKMPDPIKRRVFVRECAALTGMEESLIVNELNQAISKEIQERKRRQSRQIRRDTPRKTPASAPPPTQQNPFGDAPPFPPIDQGGNDPGFPPETGFPPSDFPPVEHLPPSPGDLPPSPDFQGPPTVKREKSQGDEFQEKDIVRLLLEGSQFVMDQETGMTVAGFILGNIEDLLDEFDSKFYADIVREFLEHFNKGEVLGQQYFIHHENEKIRDTTLGLLATPFEYSPNWDGKLEMPLQTQKKPELNFEKDTLSSVNRFKLRKVLKLMRTNQNRLKFLKPDDTIEMMKILKVQQRLTEMKQELAAFFGSVIIK